MFDLCSCYKNRKILTSIRPEGPQSRITDFSERKIIEFDYRNCKISGRFSKSVSFLLKDKAGHVPKARADSRVISPAPHRTFLSFSVLEKLVLLLYRYVHNNSTFVHASLLRY